MDPVPPQLPTPILSKNATSQPYTSTHDTRNENVTKMWHEISGKILGPMPANIFLNSFLHAAPTPAPPFNKEALDNMMNVKTELQMYDLFISAFGKCCPKLALVDCHSTSFQEFEDREIKPDICLYDDIFEGEQLLGSGKQSIENVGLMGEFKYTPNDDPFDDESPDFECTANQPRDTLGQICTYATAHTAAQFRTHVFSLLVFPQYARLLIWDRSGVIVTEKIDLKKNASVLAEFFWQYQHMSFAKRGRDETITEILNPQRTELMTTVPDAFALLEAPGRFFLISFPDDRKFIISAPHYKGTGSLTGRSTRTFKAFCMKTKKIVFLKDTWRIMSPGLRPEDEVYKKLAGAKVRHVATLEASHDIDGQVTRMTEFQFETWVKFRGPRRFRKFQHYRLVLLVFARSIQSFRNLRELIQAFRDALEAHYDAHDRAEILHRDISAGNIMITEDGRGLLVDWDLCKFLAINDEAESPPERTGTWQFMSAQLIIPSDTRVTRQHIQNRDDDLESFWHVLLWVALRHCEHRLTLSDAIASLRALFDAAYIDDAGQQKGGSNKLGELRSQTHTKLMKLDNELLHNILVDTATNLASRYFGSDKEEGKILEVEKLWMTVQSENPHLQQSELEDKLRITTASYAPLLPTFLVWKNRRTLQDAQWAVKVFDTVLDDPIADWNVGGANIDRPFPRNASQALKRKRESEVNNFHDSRKEQRLSELATVEE